jgi:hypothetical protein
MEEAIQVILVILAMLLSSFFSPARPSAPHCYLHGILVPERESAEKPSITDMIRLHFDADSKEKCERMMASYCYANVKTRGYLPTRLVGVYKPDYDGREETKYRLSPECTLIPGD